MVMMGYIHDEHNYLPILLPVDYYYWVRKLYDPQNTNELYLMDTWELVSSWNEQISLSVGPFPVSWMDFTLTVLFLH